MTEVVKTSLSGAVQPIKHVITVLPSQNIDSKVTFYTQNTLLDEVLY